MLRQIEPCIRGMVITMCCVHAASFAQHTQADFKRAQNLPQRLKADVTQRALEPIWIWDKDAAPADRTVAMWYWKANADGTWQWTAVDVRTGDATDAFDHEKLATALSEMSGRRVQPTQLALKNLRGNNRRVSFEAFEKTWDYWHKSGELKEGSRFFGNPGTRWDRPRSTSWDGKLLAQVDGHNVTLHRLDENGKRVEEQPIRLTNDGTASDQYINRFYWSNDSTRLIATRQTAGDDRNVTIVDSAPDDQLQPITLQYSYLKPGDKVTYQRPHLFNTQSHQRIPIDISLAPEPYRISGYRWKRDGSAFTYEYNPRGHQGYRVIEVDAETGESRVLIDEQTDTFFCYSSKHYLKYLDADNEIIWMSERDGWNHLYLYDWQTGHVKRQITRGEWVVRKVDRVDKQTRQIWFWAGGIHPDQDPYFLHYCRVNIDTGEVTPLTESNGHHTDVSVCSDGKYLATTWSRIDHPPVHELRSAETGELIKEIARADSTKLLDTGWVAPEPFVAKGRDGQTDIYGYLIKPTHFDPNKKYPVIEYIYAGPHDQHVEKRFYEYMRVMSLAELGFIVVRIDGMGTNWRSKAFHDVAWKNLKDAGFPDRIAWMKAAAATRPWMDIERVGIYGGSAGGQNAMRAVLDHADFYDAAAADCGCHDNRIDKMWWNEQWMGWPVDESYEKSSNVVDAHKLSGALLLTVGELDRNVDPASTLQVVDALIEADKTFEFMMFPGRGHGAGESSYGRKLRWAFFVRKLYGENPEWE